MYPMYNNPIVMPDTPSDLSTPIQVWIEGGILYGQLWDYLQKKLAAIGCAMETSDDAEGISYYHFVSKDTAENMNSEFELVVKAIEALIER